MFVSVPPAISLNVPDSIVPPATIQVECSVDRAYPNFTMSVGEQGGMHHNVTMAIRNSDGVFSLSVNETFNITGHHNRQSIIYECVILWQKNETFEELVNVTKSVALHCKYTFSVLYYLQLFTFEFILMT